MKWEEVGVWINLPVTCLEDAIRYYEQVGLVPPITRTATGIRDFQRSGYREALEFIKYFVLQVSLCGRISWLYVIYQKGDETRRKDLSILEDERKD